MIVFVGMLIFSSFWCEVLNKVLHINTLSDSKRDHILDISNRSTETSLYETKGGVGASFKRMISNIFCTIICSPGLHAVKTLARRLSTVHSYNAKIYCTHVAWRRRSTPGTIKQAISARHDRPKSLHQRKGRIRPCAGRGSAPSSVFSTAESAAINIIGERNFALPLNLSSSRRSQPANSRIPKKDIPRRVYQKNIYRVDEVDHTYTVHRRELESMEVARREMPRPHRKCASTSSVSVSVGSPQTTNSQQQLHFRYVCKKNGIIKLLHTAG